LRRSAIKLVERRDVVLHHQRDRVAVAAGLARQPQAALDRDDERAAQFLRGPELADRLLDRREVLVPAVVEELDREREDVFGELARQTVLNPPRPISFRSVMLKSFRSTGNGRGLDRLRP